MIGADCEEIKKQLEAMRDERDNFQRLYEKAAAQLLEMDDLSRVIDDLKKAQAQAEVLAEKMAQSNRELQDFAHIASHDLQEPLRKVMAFGDRLKSKFSDVLGEQGNDYLERMQNATRRMQRFIDDLLTYSRVTTKVQPFVPTDLAAVAGGVISDLEVRIEGTGATVEIKDLPVIDADPRQMHQLFQNLIGNALKFHRKDEPPKVTVSGRCIVTGETGAVEIVVADNGIGFETKYAERIFQVFQRLHGRSDYDGTGIGLSVCKKVVERHGGTILAAGVPNQGSTFTVLLPMHQKQGE